MDPDSAPTLSAPDSEAQKIPSLHEFISEKFPTFNHQSIVIEPFENESKRDVEFQEKLNTRLIELMLEFHAWSTARPVHASENTADALEKEIHGIIETENEQDKTRQRLSEFIEHIKMALAALTRF